MEKASSVLKVRHGHELAEDPDSDDSPDIGQPGHGHEAQDRDLTTLRCPVVEVSALRQDERCDGEQGRGLRVPSCPVEGFTAVVRHERCHGDEDTRLRSPFIHVIVGTSLASILSTICQDANPSSFVDFGDPLLRPTDVVCRKDALSISRRADNSLRPPLDQRAPWKRIHIARQGQHLLQAEIKQLLYHQRQRKASSELKANILELENQIRGCSRKALEEKPWRCWDLFDHFQPAWVSGLVFPVSRQSSEGGASAGRGPVALAQLTPAGLSSAERQWPADGMEDTPWTTFRQELYRMGTFLNLPAQFPVSAVRLAQAGFLRLVDGSIVCYFCGLTRNEWRRHESPQQVHQELRPDCPLMTGVNCPNVPVGDVQPAERLAEALQRWSLQSGPGGPPGPSRARTFGSAPQNGDMTVDGTHEAPESGARAAAPAAAAGPSPAPAAQTPSQQNEPARRQPPPRLGLMGGAPSSATPGTAPILDGTAQPAPPAPAPAPPHRPDSRTMVTYDELGIVTGKPKRQDMATVQSRLATFRDWSDSNRPTALQLAEAGFFYAGYADCGRCFFCAGGLKSWEPNDNPWVAHARWLPTCAYVKQCQGQSFIAIVKELSSGNNTRPISYSEVMEEMRRRQVAGDYDKELSSDPAVTSAVRAGFSQEAVEAAANRMIQEGHQLSAETLVDFLQADGSSSPSSPSEAAGAAPAEAGTNLPEADADAEREVETLRSENSDFRQRTQCKVCLDKEVSVVFLPCGHLVTCTTCSPALRACALCRQPIKGRVRVFPS